MTMTAATGIASPPYSGSGALTLSNDITFSGTLTCSSSTPVNFSTPGVRTVQAVTDVHDTVPTDAQLDTAFGTAATRGRGFIGTVDDNDADTIGYIVWATDASWFFIIGTKAT